MIKKNTEGSIYVKKRMLASIWSVDMLPSGRVTRLMMLDFFEKHNQQIQNIYDAHKNYVLIVEEAGDLVERENKDLRKRIDVLETKIKKQ